MLISKIRNIHGLLFEIKQEILLIVFRRFNKLKIMNTIDTIEYIKQHKCSISRFGDGEIRLMHNPNYSIGFQKNNALLVKRMKEILCLNNENLLLCVPIYLVDRSSIQTIYRRMWEQQNRNWYIWFYKLLRKSERNNYIFGNASFTRPYLEAIEKNQPMFIFEQIKTLWKNKKLLIVEGTQTRLGVGNDLLNNAKSIERILAPAKNAFDKYDTILDSIFEHYSNQLILLALGPTASVLAADLSMRNIQALDIGHIDLEYEWCIRGVKNKTTIPNKYVNEVLGGLEEIQEEKSIEYIRQIVHVIE